MKQILSSTICLLIGLRLFANPIAMPTIEISELYFESSGDWVLEIGYYEINQSEFPIDSIYLFSSEDSVKFSEFVFKGKTGVLILRNDSLSSEFNINRYGDSLVVK